jgi:hypothetical protein
VGYDPREVGCFSKIAGLAGLAENDASGLFPINGCF